MWLLMIKSLIQVTFFTLINNLKYESVCNTVYFLGQDCSRGQECLLDSNCNGTICVCNEGLFTLQIADTYNCVPGNPSDAGFTDGDGGLVIALNPNEKKGMSKPSLDPEAEEATTMKAKPVSSSMAVAVSAILVALVVLFNLF